MAQASPKDQRPACVLSRRLNPKMAAVLSEREGDGPDKQSSTEVPREGGRGVVRQCGATASGEGQEHREVCAPPEVPICKSRREFWGSIRVTGCPMLVTVPASLPAPGSQSQAKRALWRGRLVFGSKPLWELEVPNKWLFFKCQTRCCCCV